jgi:SAM-dependent methyltransferase
MSETTASVRLRTGMPEPLRESQWLEYLGEDLVNWSDDLEELHSAVESHFIDVWTREASIAALRAATVRGEGVVADLGCASGYLLRQIASERPDLVLVGIDAEASGLPAARRAVPDAILAHASVTALPLPDSTLDVVLALNLLEHVPADVDALREMARCLRPGGRAILVVPSNPRLYDYYDAHLFHERRYGRGEMADKARRVGLRVVGGSHLGGLVYPGFWAVKTRNRLLHRNLSAAQISERVEKDISGSAKSRLAPLACRLERRMVRAGVRFRRGIRELIVVERAT